MPAGVTDCELVMAYFCQTGTDVEALLAQLYFEAAKSLRIRGTIWRR